MDSIELLLAIYLLGAYIGQAPMLIHASAQNLPPKDRIQYRPGDILIGAAMQVSSKKSNGNCEEDQHGIQLVEVMNMIIDQTNADRSILDGIKLGTIMFDTCGSEPHALQQVITNILPLVLSDSDCEECVTHSPLAGVVGATFSSVSMQLATILQVFSIPQVSYWSTSVELSDKARFPYFFRSVPSDVHQVAAIVRFIRDRNWNYISVVYDDDNYGTDGFVELVHEADQNDICIAYSKALDKRMNESNVDGLIRDLMSKSEARAVVIFTVKHNAENILKHAQHVPGAVSLVWIGVDAWTGQLPIAHSNADYLDSLDGTVGFMPKLDIPENFTEYITSIELKDNFGQNLSRNPWFPRHISTRNNCSLPGDTNTSGLRLCDLNERINSSTFRLIETPIANAVYAFVHALDQYHKVKCNGKAVFCEELRNMAGEATLAAELNHYLKNVSFAGVGGRHFQFDKNHDGPPMYDVLTFSKDRVRNESANVMDGWMKAGIYADNELTWHTSLPKGTVSTKSTCSEPCKPGEAQVQSSSKCCWFCQKCASRAFVNSTRCEDCLAGTRPNAARNGCVSLPDRTMEYNSTHAIFVLSLGAFGLLCTSIVTVIYVVYRDTAIVRASGKELCFFVLTGIFITLFNCFTVTLNPTAISCSFTRVILAIGPTCMYVGLLMKTIRVVFIFQSKRIMKTKAKKYLQPTEFTLITSAVASVQIPAVAIWLVVDSPNVQEVELADSVFRTCETLASIKILYGLIYPFLIIIICTVLATINRNVPTGFKETLFIGFAMYTTLVIWVSFIPIFTTNTSDIPLKLATVSAALSFSAITILFCLFVPRCYVMLVNPALNTAESVMSKSRAESSVNLEPEKTARSVRGAKTDVSQVPTVDLTGVT